MSKGVGFLAMLAVAFAGVGCMDIHQVVHMKHDGSGRITERIRFMPRAVRLLKGRASRSGEAEESFEIFSESEVQSRVKSFGAVALKTKKLTTLEDGSRQMDAEYTFQDINKVNLWVTPTFKCNQKDRDGKMTFKYDHIIPNHDRPPRYFKANRMSVKTGGAPARPKVSSPSEQKKFEGFASVFQDMLKDFKVKIEVVAPIEDFEDARMVNKGIPTDGNRVTLLNIEGENVAGAREIIKQFILGEVGGKADAWGGTWKRMEDPIPNTFTPYGAGYRGIAFRFLKLVEVKGYQKPGPKKKRSKSAAKKKSKSKKE